MTFSLQVYTSEGDKLQLTYSICISQSTEALRFRLFTVTVLHISTYWNSTVLSVAPEYKKNSSEFLSLWTPPWLWFSQMSPYFDRHMWDPYLTHEQSQRTVCAPSPGWWPTASQYHNQRIRHHCQNWHKEKVTQMILIMTNKDSPRIFKTNLQANRSIVQRCKINQFPLTY